MEFTRKIGAGALTTALSFAALTGAGCRNDTRIAEISGEIETAITASPDNTTEILKQRVEDFMHRMVNIHDNDNTDYRSERDAIAEVLAKHPEAKEAVAQHVEGLKERIRRDDKFALKFRGVPENLTPETPEMKAARIISVRSGMMGTISAIELDLRLPDIAARAK